MSAFIPWVVLLGLAAMVARYLRNESTTRRKNEDQQQATLGEVLEELTSLRSALLASGAVERPAKLPPCPPLPEPVRTPEDPPSTKPVQSRTVPAPLRSEPLPVPVEDAVQRAMRRIERHAKVPPDVAARWERRLRALGAELGLPTEAEPTDVQLDRVIRELYEAEADVKDARLAAPPPLEATLASAASPSAQIPDVEVKPLPATVRPPPHRPPRPIADPLAGAPVERPTSSATRTAETFRNRTTLRGVVAAPRAAGENEVISNDEIQEEEHADDEARKR